MAFVCFLRFLTVLKNFDLELLIGYIILVYLWGFLHFSSLKNISIYLSIPVS